LNIFFTPTGGFAKTGNVNPLAVAAIGVVLAATVVAVVVVAVIVLTTSGFELEGKSPFGVLLLEFLGQEYSIGFLAAMVVVVLLVQV